MDVERRLKKLLSKKQHLTKQEKQQEAIRRLPPKWIAVYPSSFHQVEEETKWLRNLLKRQRNNEQDE